MKRKFLAAAVLGVMVSVTPAGAYAASTETSPLPVNSESDTQTESRKNRNFADLICRSCPSEAKQERGSEQWQDLHYQEIYTSEKTH